MKHFLLTLLALTTLSCHHPYSHSWNESELQYPSHVLIVNSLDINPKLIGCDGYLLKHNDKYGKYLIDIYCGERYEGHIVFNRDSFKVLENSQ